MNPQERARECETAVLLKLLEGDPPELALLRAQVHSARVRREFTGAGFWTELLLDPDAPRLSNRESLQISGVYGSHPDLEAGVGFTLFVEDGMVRSLEGYTYEEPWPDDLAQLQIEQNPSGAERLAHLMRLVRSAGESQ